MLDDGKPFADDGFAEGFYQREMPEGRERETVLLRVGEHGD
jgi:hypothetical protein